MLYLISLSVCLLLFPPAIAPAAGQIREGELRVTVIDPDGLAVAATVALDGRNPVFSAATETDARGRARLGRLPRGVYRLSVAAPGFETFSDLVEVRSAVPVEWEVTLGVAPAAAEVTVVESAPLLDPFQTGIVVEAGRRQLDEISGASLGRSTVEVVTTMPGWLVEANAVLHPRGSEYDTQYVIDGMPLYDNRSIGFAPAFETAEFEAVNVMTAGIPAEFGRRLGGVIALDTRRAKRPGHAFEADLRAGSYATGIVSLGHQFAGSRTAVSLGAQVGATDRYLDPPSLENFTNRATSEGFHARLERDLSTRDRLSLYVRSARARFLVPNDPLEQARGQRQDRQSAETAVQTHFQRVVAPDTLAAFRFMLREVTADLASNAVSEPVVRQDRRFREGALVGNLTVERERHTLKFGGDVRVNHIRKEFLLGARGDEEGTPIDFRNAQRSTDAALFVQDHLRFGNLAVNLGLRFDRYDLLVEDTAWSPRVGVSYWWPGIDLLVRGAYDRVFQPPPMENLLLSSAAARVDLDAVEGAISVPAGRADFFEVGFRRPLFGILRLDASQYWRIFQNYIDDDVFLNTGLSFPITFDTARITGTDVRLEMPSWRGLSSFISYANMTGRARSPVTGGLFFNGGEAEELREPGRRFAISQDQRNTVAAQLRFQPHERVWFAAGARYGSGLPVELKEDHAGGADFDEETGIGIEDAVLDKVDFERGRLRPSFNLDLAVGLRLWEAQPQSVSLQFDVRNATDRLNVINFSGVFSGTALAPGRQVMFRMKIDF